MRVALRITGLSLGLVVLLALATPPAWGQKKCGKKEGEPFAQELKNASEKKLTVKIVSEGCAETVVKVGPGETLAIDGIFPGYLISISDGVATREFVAATGKPSLEWAAAPPEEKKSTTAEAAEPKKEPVEIKAPTPGTPPSSPAPTPEPTPAGPTTAPTAETPPARPVPMPTPEVVEARSVPTPEASSSSPAPKPETPPASPAPTPEPEQPPAAKPEAPVEPPKSVVPAPPPTKPSVSLGEILEEINLVRRNPAAYISILEEWKKYYKGNELQLPNRIPIDTNEGPALVDEAIEFLRKQTASEALSENNSLAAAALVQLKDIQTNNISGHRGSDNSLPDERVARLGRWLGSVGELIDYGSNTAREVVIKIIMDDGVASRGHRLKLFTAGFKLVGLAQGNTKDYGNVCVVVLTNDFIPKN